MLLSNYTTMSNNGFVPEGIIWYASTISYVYTNYTKLTFKIIIINDLVLRIVEMTKIPTNVVLVRW